MGDWDFSLIENAIIVIISMMILFLALLFIKNRKIRIVIKMLIVITLLFMFYKMITFKVTQDNKDNQREMNINKRLNDQIKKRKDTNSSVSPSQSFINR